MRELSNPGASGSLFYLSADDEFIVKTVQKKEAKFLQKLLPGYYLVSSRLSTMFTFVVLIGHSSIDLHFYFNKYLPSIH